MLQSESLHMDLHDRSCYRADHCTWTCTAYIRIPVTTNPNQRLHTHPPHRPRPPKFVFPTKPIPITNMLNKHTQQTHTTCSFVLSHPPHRTHIRSEDQFLSDSLFIYDMHLQLDPTQALRFIPHSLTRYSPQSPWQLMHRPPRLLLQSTVMQRRCRNYSTRSLDKQENMSSKSFASRLSTTHTHGKGRRFQLKLSSNPTSHRNTA